MGRRLHEKEVGMRLATGGLFATALAALCLILGGADARAATASSPGATWVSYATGQIVPVPASIPHQEGAYVDRRLIPNLRYLTQRFKIYITEGYAGSLTGVGTVGCPKCHARNSDHFTGLAVDIAAQTSSTRCDAGWKPITALAKWAEPRPNLPRAPFRWVGYDGDSGHGCGHHLHLSWNAAPTISFTVSDWVELFRVKQRAVSGQSRDEPSKPAGPSGGSPSGPNRGAQPAETGGVSAGRVFG